MSDEEEILELLLLGTRENAFGDSVSADVALWIEPRLFQRMKKAIVLGFVCCSTGATRD